MPQSELPCILEGTRKQLCLARIGDKQKKVTKAASGYIRPPKKFGFDKVVHT